jgi:hypothetical protein
MDLTLASALSQEGLLGHAAYVLLVLSMLMRTLFWLRLLVIASAILGISYSVLILNDPVSAFWETCLVLVNIAQLVLSNWRNLRARFTPEELAFIMRHLPGLSRGEARALLDAGAWYDAMALACTIWGLSPLFYALLAHVPPLEVLAHRTLWSLVIFAGVLAAQGRLSACPRRSRHLGNSGCGALGGDDLGELVPLHLRRGRWPHGGGLAGLLHLSRLSRWPSGPLSCAKGWAGRRGRRGACGARRSHPDDRARRAALDLADAGHDLRRLRSAETLGRRGARRLGDVRGSAFPAARLRLPRLGRTRTGA